MHAWDCTGSMVVRDSRLLSDTTGWLAIDKQVRLESTHETDVWARDGASATDRREQSIECSPEHRRQQGDRRSWKGRIAY